MQTLTGADLEPAMAEAARLAATRYGWIRREAILTAGVTPGALRSAVERGLLVPDRHHRGVIRFAGSPDTPLSSAARALVVAGEGAVLRGRDAAILHGIWRGGLRAPHDVTYTNRRYPRVDRRLVTPRRSRRLRPIEDVATVAHLPAVKPPRWFYEIASDAHGRRRIETEASRVLGKTDTTLLDLIEQYDHVGNLRNRGLARDVVRAFDPTVDNARSVPEVDFPAFCRHWGLPGPVLGYAIELNGRHLEADAAYVGWRIWIEVDSLQHHSGLTPTEYDATRQNPLIIDGWLVLRFPARLIRDHPRQVALTIARALLSRGCPDVPATLR